MRFSNAIEFILLKRIIYIFMIILDLCLLLNIFMVLAIFLMIYMSLFSWSYIIFIFPIVYLPDFIRDFDCVDLFWEIFGNSDRTRDERSHFRSKIERRRL